MLGIPCACLLPHQPRGARLQPLEKPAYHRIIPNRASASLWLQVLDGLSLRPYSIPLHVAFHEFGTNNPRRLFLLRGQVPGQDLNSEASGAAELDAKSVPSA